MSVPFRIPAHNILNFAVDPADRTRIYAATDAGLFASSDTGLTWTLQFSHPSLAVEVDPFDSNTVYLGVSAIVSGDRGFYRSTDRGQTWTQVTSDLFSGYPISSISADPNVSGLIYALGPGFYRSQDSGQTWTSAALPPSLGGGDSPSSQYYFTPQAVLADPTQPNQVFVSGIQHCIGFCPVIPALVRSTDAGVTLSELNVSYPVASLYSTNGVLGLSIDPATGDLYLLVDGQLSAYRPSTAYMQQQLAMNVAAIAFDPTSPGVFYEALLDGSLAQSPDAGMTWNTVAQLPAAASQLAVSAGGVLNVSQPGGTTDAYVIRYDSSSLVSYGTYLSGGATTEKAAATTTLDQLWIAGTTGPGLPLLNSVQASFGGATDGFLAEFDSDGTLLSSTDLGGSGDDELDSIRVLPDGSVVVIGVTNSPDFAQTLAPSAIGGGRTFIIHVQP